MTAITNEKEPAVADVPVMLPAEEFRLNPAGNVPELTDHVYGIVPCRAKRVREYASPIVPFGAAVVAILKGGGATLMLRSWAAI